MLGYGGNNSGNPSFVGGGTIKSQPTLYIIEKYYEVKYDYGDAAKDDLSFPATAPAAYADRIYIDKEDHTYQMPRPIRKGCLFNGWDNRDDWQWGWLASHGYTSTQEDTRLGSVSRLTEDAYTHTMNFVTMLHKIEESTFSALRDVTLSAKFIEAGVGGSPSCLTVGFDPKGGTVNGQKANYKVYITKDVNAWAMANGCIRVYSGLMDMMTDDEVLGVVGHEIGHVALGHSKKAMQTAYTVSAARDAAGAAGGATVAALNSSQLGDLTEKFINAQFSQSQESAADDYSFDQLQAKKLNTRGLVTAFQKLAELDGGKSDMMSSHPSSAKGAQHIEDRIAKAK